RDFTWGSPLESPATLFDLKAFPRYSRLVGVGENRVFLSRDAGNTWEIANLPVDLSSTGREPQKLWSICGTRDGATLWVAGGTGGIRGSKEGGSRGSVLDFKRNAGKRCFSELAMRGGARFDPAHDRAGLGAFGAKTIKQTIMGPPLRSRFGGR